MKNIIKGKNLIKILFIAYSVIVSLQFLLIYVIRDRFIRAIYESPFRHWGFSDWLINYQGGFVRRGLWGEFLLFLYNNFGIDIGHAIIFIVIASTVALILFTIYFFKKKGVSFFLLPNILLLGIFAMHDITSFRRDALMLLLIFAALYLYKKWQEGQKNSLLYYILMSITGIAVVLTHEASFFCFVPFIMFHYFCSCESKGFVKRVIKTISISLPVIATMGVACIFKGNEDIANTIWNSYAPYFSERFGEILPMGYGVSALAWSAESTLKDHFILNYVLKVSFIPHRIYAWIPIYFFAFYLMSNVNKIRMFKYENPCIDNAHLATVLAIQFVGLLPMFTVLSCDIGRIVMYWSFSSFFIFAFFDKTEFPVFSKFGHRAKLFFDNNRLLSNKWFYFLISITIFVPFCHFPPEAIYSSVIGNLVKLVQYAATFI